LKKRHKHWHLTGKRLNKGIHLVVRPLFLS